jgi:uncharacterized RDD family membrane protein YckC
MLDHESNGTPDLVALLELRELVASELDELSGNDYLQRSFRPLTDGLGLESPQMPEFVRQAPRPAAPRVEKTAPVEPVEVRRSTSPLANAIENSVPVPVERPAPVVVAPAPTVQPPPMPKASFYRRLFSAVMDEIFVLSLFLLALGLTLRLLSGGGFNWTFASIRNFQNSAFVRFAIMEFSTLWLSYFAVCVGILDMTFGMWVWGLRITYGKGDHEPRALRKIMRILLSFLFYAPVFPLLLLAVQRKGRNLLDLLSRTSLYRTV